MVGGRLQFQIHWFAKAVTLTVSIVLDLYQSFILFTHCGPEGRAALWGTKYQSQLLHVLIYIVIHQLKDTGLLGLTWSKRQ